MICTIDMHIRDERVLTWLKSQAVSGEVQVSGDKIAVAFKCHPHTGRAILRRLVRTGHLGVCVRKYQGGFIYKVSNAS